MQLKRLLLTFVIAAGLTVAATAQVVWQPVAPAELQQTKSRVEQDADSEVLRWEVKIVDEYTKTRGWVSKIEQYVKVKVFNERGRERFAKYDIQYGGVDAGVKIQIKDIAARTTKPDGSSIDLKAADIFDNDVLRVDDVKVRSKSFVVPGVEPGAIVEIRWREVQDKVFNYSRLMLAREIPVQFVKYTVKPGQAPYVGMRLQSFNVTSQFVEEPDGFYSITMRDVPAFRAEPAMPSEYDLKPWVLMYYGTENEKTLPDAYWRDIAKETFETHKGQLKPNSDLKAAAVKAIGDASAPDDKLRRIFDFVRASIKDIADDGNGMSPEERDKFDYNKNAAEALKRGVGTAHDVMMVFGAMANAAGFDARIANAASRADAKFDKGQTNDYFIRFEIVAINVGGIWKFFNLADRHLPYGMIGWQFEGQHALISDSDTPVWTDIPSSPPEASQTFRTASVELASDGSIEGDVKIEVRGHVAAVYREAYDDKSPAEREKGITTQIKILVGSTSELSAISIENLTDGSKPLFISFHLKVPSYADKTGRRIFLQPNIFKRAQVPLFSSATRNYDIAFNYVTLEQDDVNIKLPTGFAAESIEVPKPVRDDATGSSDDVKIAVAGDGRGLEYKRRFAFGKPDALRFPDTKYRSLKSLFDSFQKLDTMLIVLRADAAPSS